MLLLVNPEYFRCEFLPRWLRQWKGLLNLAAAEMGTEGKSESTSSLGFTHSDETVRPFTSGIPRVGEVRLLAPELTPSSSLPVYVLLLQEWAPGWKLVAPFSRFTVPATPGEVLIQEHRNQDGATGILSTLCLWNAVSVPDRTLQSSWLVETWEEAVYKVALIVFETLRHGPPLPAAIESRTGEPLSGQRSDSRNQYLREDAGLLSGLIRSAFAEASHAGVRPVLPIHQVPLFGADTALAEENNDAMAFAADDSPSKVWTRHFALAGREEKLLLTSEGKGRSILAYVLGADDEPCGALDGCWLVGSDSTEPVEIQHGHAILDGNLFGDSIGIRQQDGLSIPLCIQL